ncbi:hypothetical protein [Glycomyces algeriensis]|uniref:Uncharacterized protein n=1 Tax=Glycomyces algeriensis TaxID=256037 RepID=A0A9W6LFY7_9ACTN|nr:hypothetical protein [Glycomyces algeriensis]MDA1367225.1 hypothetical protein [Glycomyces algeriensis]MDR7353391.1 hypothetical protein [Glycomyces algeriensis]GLI41086.1 hypothetical protein GALLR39Z86_09360 [Glycomyces algeriensis]
MTLHRITQGLAALALTAAAALAFAAPAHADALACTDHLKANGVRIGPIAAAACAEGEHWDGHVRCVDQLTAANVGQGLAENACHRAAL